MLEWRRWWGRGCPTCFVGSTWGFPRSTQYPAAGLALCAGRTQRAAAVASASWVVGRRGGSQPADLARSLAPCPRPQPPPLPRSLSGGRSTSGLGTWELPSHPHSYTHTHKHTHTYTHARTQTCTYTHSHNTHAHTHTNIHRRPRNHTPASRAISLAGTGAHELLRASLQDSDSRNQACPWQAVSVLQTAPLRPPAPSAGSDPFST